MSGGRITILAASTRQCSTEFPIDGTLTITADDTKQAGVQLNRGCCVLALTEMVTAPEHGVTDSGSMGCSLHPTATSEPSTIAALSPSADRGDTHHKACSNRAEFVRSVP